MTRTLKLEAAGAIVATVAAAVGAVWLTGDLRAFGVIVALAGVVVGVGIGRQEWQMSQRHPDDTEAHASGNADITKAA